MANPDNWWEFPDQPNWYDPSDNSQWNPNDPYNRPPGAPVPGQDTKPAPPVVPVEGPVEGPGGGGEEFGGSGTPFPGRPNYRIPKVPQFQGPAFKWDESFAAPSWESIGNDPGYQFRLNQGQRALEASAAGRGVLRTGGTLKDILGYGQSLASQEYQNVFDRALTGYNTRFGTAKDSYDRNYKLAQDTYAPNLLDWQTRANAAIGGENAYFSALVQQWLHDNPSADSILNAGRE